MFSSLVIRSVQENTLVNLVGPEVTTRAKS